MTYYVPHHQSLTTNPAAPTTAYLPTPASIAAMSSTYTPHHTGTTKRCSSQNNQVQSGTPATVNTTTPATIVGSTYPAGVAIPYHPANDSSSTITGIYAMPQNVFSTALPPLQQQQQPPQMVHSQTTPPQHHHHHLPQHQHALHQQQQLQQQQHQHHQQQQHPSITHHHSQAYSHHMPHQTNAVINTLVPPPPSSQYNTATVTTTNDAATHVVVASEGGTVGVQPNNHNFPNNKNTGQSTTSAATAGVYNASNSIPNQPKHPSDSGSGGGGNVTPSTPTSVTSANPFENNNSGNAPYPDTRKQPFHNKRTFINNSYQNSGGGGNAGGRPNYLLSMNGPRKSNPDYYATNTSSHFNRNTNFNAHKRINNNGSSSISSEQSFNNKNSQLSEQLPTSGGGGSSVASSATNNAVTSAPDSNSPTVDQPTPSVVVNSRSSVRPKPPMLDLRRSSSNRNSPNTNSCDSNQSPLSTASCGEPASPQIYMTRSAAAHIPPSPQQIHSHSAVDTTAAAAAAAAAQQQCQQAFYGTYNGSTTSMYVRLGQAYFAHVSWMQGSLLLTQ